MAASLANSAAVKLLKARLREKYTSRATVCLKPLPGSANEVLVHEIFAEVVVTERVEADPQRKCSRLDEGLFSPIDEFGRKENTLFAAETSSKCT